MCSGNYSTLNCMEYLKTESVCTLSDILEEIVAEKYFLSRQQTEKIVLNTNKKDCGGGKLFKQYPGEKFLSMNDAFMTDIGTDTASTVTARYYKGLGNHKDNLVVKQIGRLESDKRDNPNPYRVYDADGIAPTLNCAGGGAENLTLQLGSGGVLQEPHEITRNEIGGVLQQGKTLMARDYKGIGNQGMTGVLHLINQQNPMCAPAQILSQHEKTEEYQTKNKQEPQ